MSLSKAPGVWRWEQRGDTWWRIHDVLNIEDGPHDKPGTLTRRDVKLVADDDGSEYGYEVVVRTTDQRIGHVSKGYRYTYSQDWRFTTYRPEGWNEAAAPRHERLRQSRAAAVEAVVDTWNRRQIFLVEGLAPQQGPDTLSP
jgi:hypothetical protein